VNACVELLLQKLSGGLNGVVPYTMGGDVVCCKIRVVAESPTFNNPHRITRNKSYIIPLYFLEEYVHIWLSNNVIVLFVSFLLYKCCIQVITVLHVRINFNTKLFTSLMTFKKNPVA
jgi:hypothetical protein